MTEKKYRRRTVITFKITAPHNLRLYATVDRDEWPRVRQHKWSANKSVTKNRGWYAKTHINGKDVRLHTFIMNPPPGFKTDHKDRNGLHCTHGNMRLATAAQNSYNRGPSNGSVTGFKGVTRHKTKKKWIAKIRCNGRAKYLGSFDSPEDAALAYDESAKQLFGEFAYLNFPNGKKRKPKSR